MLQGLSSEQAKDNFKKYGSNTIPEKKDNLTFKIIKKFLSPISLMLLGASFLSLLMGKFFDFTFILILLFMNIFISLWQENKADHAIKKLNEKLSQKIKTLRDDKWQKIASELLVPADIIEVSNGDIIPADGIILKTENASFNESTITGESLPKDKNLNDKVFSGSFIASGIAIIKIVATGKNTNFGKTILSVEKINKKSLLEKDIIVISKFLTFFSIFFVIILSLVFIWQRVNFLDLLTLDLSLIIAGIPVSLPTIMTLIIEFGVIALATKKVIVRRLSSLEDLANINLLLTDKTGTLTKNEITIKNIYPLKNYSANEIISYANLIAKENPDEIINRAIINYIKENKVTDLKRELIKFIPADSVRKRSVAFLTDNLIVVLGASQVILSLSSNDKTQNKIIQNKIDEFAKNGYRTLIVATGKGSEEKNLAPIGVIALSDTLRTDATETISYLLENGINVSMVTGDNVAIARQITEQLSLKGKIITKEKLDLLNWDLIDKKFFENYSAYAEILPNDKFRLVQKAKQFFTVAANGDGVNDLPAIKAANVGIAVENAVSALKSTADIVLLTDGISIIKDAILESRKIFERLYTYSLYRISESLRLIVTIVILGILYKVYPLTPLQIITIALLNDIPTISLAWDKVQITNRPAKINAKKRFVLSSFYGLVGVGNSLFLFFIMKNLLHLNWNIIQTIYFLKITVSGHMLIYVAHTKERWFKFLPSKEVILATTLTQLASSVLALTGFLMPTKISFITVLLVWVWSFLWMQIGELTKIIDQKFQGN